jgi:hypothetical protein
MGVPILTRRAAAVAALLILGACSQSAAPAGGQGTDKFAGLDGEILRWRQDILAGDPLCRSTVADQKCAKFEVACKAERTVTPAEQAQGVTAHVVTMITWDGFDPKFQHAQSGTKAAEFTKTGKGWTRADHGPVYMQTCGDMK